jgi:PAS domain S-box-containing protein
MPAASETLPINGQPVWLDAEPELPDWMQADPRARLHDVTRGLTEERTFTLAALTTFDATAGLWRLEAISVATDLPALAQHIAEANLLGLAHRLEDAPLTRAAPPGSEPGPDLIIAQQLADLLDPLVCAGAPNAEPAIRVWTNVPLWVGSHLLGALTAGAAQEDLSEIQQELLQAFAGQAVLALANNALFERASASLQRSREAERRYHRLLESSADAIFLIDPAGRFVFLNRQAEALCGYARTELLGRSFLRLVQPEDRPVLVNVTERLSAGEALPETIELTLATKSGRCAPAEISLTPLRSDGCLDAVQLVARDIRQRLLHEQEREQLLAQSEAMGRRLRASFAQIGAAVAQSRDLQAALRLIVQSAGELLEADHTMLWLLDHDERWLSLAATAGGPVAVEPPAPGQRWRVDEGFIGKAAGQSRPLRYTGPAGALYGPTLTAPWGDATEEVSCLCAPLANGEGPLGALAVVRRRPADFSEVELQLLSSFAHQASVAIEQARLTEHLHQKGLECETVVSNSADGIAVLDRRRCIIQVNPALQRILGYSAEQLIGRRCWERLHEPARADTPCGEDCPYREDGIGEPTLFATHQVQRPDGRLITIAISYGLVRDYEGQISRVIATVRDVTRQAELDRMRDDFVSSVSHELRTPLALIKGYVGTLLRPDITVAPDVQARFLRNINQASDRLGRLIDDMLTVSRLESDKLAMDCQPHDLAALAREAVEHATVQYPDLKIELEPPAEPLPVRVDAGRIAQVLGNLISNAAKFSPQGRPVRVRAERVGAKARLSVIDQGAGIAPEHLEHLFEKFYRVNDAALRQTPGLGLGLHISRGIIKAHGGRIWVESQLGFGSAFGFDLELREP